jgi:hypothetical protein
VMALFNLINLSIPRGPTKSNQHRNFFTESRS